MNWYQITNINLLFLWQWELTNKISQTFFPSYWFLHWFTKRYYSILYHLEITISLTSDGQTIRRTVDKGQEIILDCSQILSGILLVPPFQYSWRRDSTPFSTDAMTTITADSDAEYECRASGLDFKGNRDGARGAIAITVRGMYYVHYNLIT